jgi:hypothetical protein
MTRQPAVDILTRPFATSPVTGLMATDGILVANNGPARLGAFIVNRTGQVLHDVVVSARVDPKSCIRMTTPEVRVATLLPDAPTLVLFDTDAAAAPAGNYEMTLDVEAHGCDGALVRATPARRIFVATLEGEGENRQLRVPEGSIRTEVLEWQTRSGGSPLPSHVKMTMVPRRPFGGKFSPLPFQDPIWKAAGAVMAETSVTQLVAVGTVSTAVGLGAGAGVATGTNASKGTAIATGVAVTVLVAGVALFLLDGEDTFRWGEKHTDVDHDEYTIREEVEGRSLAAPGTIPEVGCASPAEAEWIFRRYTNKRVMTVRDVVPVSTTHYASRRDITVNRRPAASGGAIDVTARFDKDGRALAGASLFVTAMIAHDGALVAHLPLVDQGTGTYAGSYVPAADDARDLEVFVVAQDVNDADPNDPPMVQAKRLGGIVVSTPVVRDGRLMPDCS